MIAHELMHAWLRMSGYDALPPFVEEGLCQLLAALWLQRLPCAVWPCLPLPRSISGMQFHCNCTLCISSVDVKKGSEGAMLMHILWNSDHS